ncbi:MAG: cobyrinate a,c-diamide synthase [Fulvimarina manganoxydans]|uniref:cobyrinate a,c-diamide synthase n=1 Tax=Fulvimarina manganoxydans TaxID=937218 RepID=UPI002353EDE4|nr:cobyrinate a,c-diamide synthase [Fulvimarina manganoxydans]MCK5934765.1 cobyrinate a,c-diamide synthase [Fulvimarina manganoxydans]
MTGLLVAAPSSGAGKTTVTLALIAALVRRGFKVASAKAGPDYIDPAFHRAAGARSSVNLDPWAMRSDFIESLAGEAALDADLFVVEAMMGVFDGAADGTGSAADLAQMLELRVVLVVDCAKQSHSVAALVSGFAGFRPGLSLAGLILNRVGSDRHETLLREALRPLGIPVLAALRRSADLALPERHLGLVQAQEHQSLGAFVDRAANWMEEDADMAAIAELARRRETRTAKPVATLPPLGQHVAIASDGAFAFAYPHLLEGWRQQGAQLSTFSPLENEAPDESADAVYLPGGYPELHGGRLAAASDFRAGMMRAADRGATIYGECGGYMTLAEGLIDAGGERHAMLGLLPLETSFAERKLHLGYRRIRPVADGLFPGAMTAHEFHYATIVKEGAAERLFVAEDARGEPMGPQGLRRGRVFGSFMHLIDRADDR